MNLKPMQKAFRTFSGAFAVSWLALTPVWADDTEIFYANSSDETITPNILFIIDTSGSMDNIVDDADGNSTGKDRLEHVQEAFVELLSTLSNVNVGLMRFSNPGGPILYPVSDLDSDAVFYSDSTVTSRIGSDDDDAQELDSGTMLVNENYLNMTIVTGGYHYFTDRVSGDEDDAEQDNSSNGDMTRYSNDLDFRGSAYNSGTEQIVGVRFSGSEVPDDATVTRAYIEFTADNGGNDTDTDFLIYGQKDDNGSFGSNDGNISDRDETDEVVPWTIEGLMVDGDKIQTPDLSEIIMEILSDDSWDAPNGEEDDMTFIIYPDPADGTYGHKEMYSRDGADSYEDRPKLYIEYYTGVDVPESEQSSTGLRFTNLGIPRGVDITSAYIEFVATTTTSDPFTFEIVAEDTASPAAYTSADNNITVGRTYTSETVAWSSSDSVAPGDTFRTPDLIELVEAVTEEGSSWCGGDNMAFMITGTEGLRQVYSHDGDASSAPRLVVNYDPESIPDGTSCYQATTVQTTSASSNDVEEQGSTVSLTSDTLDMDDGRDIGIRFADLLIPQGAQINDAYLEFTQTDDHDDSGTTSMTISVESTTNAEPFEDENGTLDDRTHGASVPWNTSSTWYDGNTYQSPDISGLVTDIVGDDNWASGNAIAFKIETTGSDRSAYSTDGSPGEAPRLVVEYTADGSGETNITVRQELISVVNSLSHNGYTPVQDTMYEAAKYYRGEEVTYGLKRGGPNDSGPHSYTRVSHEGSMEPGTYEINNPSGCDDSNMADDDCEDQTISGVGADGAQYLSPIVNYCQKESHIILLTDGFANRDHSTTEVKDLIGISDATDCVDEGTGDGGECVQDLAKWMHENDMSEVDNADSNGQTITTHTIGFDFEEGSDWLEAVALAGGGNFKQTSNSSALVEFVEETITLIQKTDNTFVAPVAAVNQFNRLNHLNNIYFAVFRPDEKPTWEGNVKKYSLGEGNVVLGVDQTESAVDEGTGFFKDTAVDLWDANPGDDLLGKDVEKGGAASQTPGRDDRNVYFFAVPEGDSVSYPVDLTTSTRLVHTDNANGSLTKDMFDQSTMSDAELLFLIEWMRGLSLSDGAAGDDRHSFLDPLHSRPVAVTYNVSEDNPDVTIFVGTNGGSLRAINGETGVEDFIFFPEATLPIQWDLALDASTTPHPYGLDGHIVPWINDNGADGINVNDAEDFVKLFFGMRRGGRNYYAMDVTNRQQPMLDWVIEGGSGAFAELGQSWGTPIPGRIRVGDGDIRDVLFISGGYDESNDEDATRVDDTMGRAIYIVDALTGARIWSASPHANSSSESDASGYNQQFSAMRYSIPATLTVADVNADGLDDLIVVGDTGGQVWRFDISNGKPFEEVHPDDEPGQFVSGGVVADVGVASGDNTAENNRRFYHAPDVALVERDGERELAITIGSGYRAHPLDEVVEDRFFMFRQATVFGPPAAYETLVLSDLYNATDNRVDDGNRDDNGDATVNVDGEEDTLSASKGWYINLHSVADPGEKVLSTPLTIRDRVIFITYTPSAPLIADCGTSQAGRSRVYYMWLENAAPIKTWDDVDNSDEYCDGSNCDENDRMYDLNTPSIIDEPVVICTEFGCDIFTGAEKPPIDRLTGDRIRKTYWRKDN